MRGCEKFHPIIALAYYLPIMIITASAQSPYLTVLSLIFSAIYAVELLGRRMVKLGIIVLIMYALSCVVNLFFNNAGVTVLFYLPTGNAVTAETLLYSLNTGAAMCALILWFACMTETVTSDKTVYLFGAVAPRLGLLISMTLRFIPLLSRRLKQSALAHKFVGYDIYGGKLSDRAKNAVQVLTSVTASSVEKAAITANSMKGRGYGKKGVRRTNYTVYRFAAKDALAGILIVICTAVPTAGLISGAVGYRFYPDAYIEYNGFTPVAVFFWAVLCALPIMADIKEYILRRKSEVNTYDAV